MICSANDIHIFFRFLAERVQPHNDWFQFRDLLSWLNQLFLFPFIYLFFYLNFCKLSSCSYYFWLFAILRNLGFFFLFNLNKSFYFWNNIDLIVFITFEIGHYLNLFLLIFRRKLFYSIKVYSNLLLLNIFIFLNLIIRLLFWTQWQSP